MTVELLRRALTDPGDPPMRPVPARVSDLLETLHAPPRLAAHLRAVHDVAWQLTDWVRRCRPAVAFDRPSVLFGAATHDVGKVVHVEELSGPGNDHERAGYELLLTDGVEERLARFARDHASWTAAGIGFEDLLVSPADKVWKGKRVPDLEQLVVNHLAEPDARLHWQVFMALDDELDRIAQDAPRRLAFQSSHPVTGWWRAREGSAPATPAPADERKA
ncbi:phosphohydrolase [Actinosynnema sp. NPDC023658]|uniref:phosphohydrolase n=1 Tax=Actinosynnema sp. NPDC023658 TaxID=3155465 RepID=UPI0033D6748E